MASCIQKSIRSGQRSQCHTKGPKDSSGPRHHHSMYLNVLPEPSINVNDRVPGQSTNKKALLRASGLSICLFCTTAMKKVRMDTRGT
jgi:hypothetical protein